MTRGSARPAGRSPSSEPEPWSVVACCVAGTAVGGATIASFGLGVVLKDIVHDLSWTRGGASSAISLYLLGLGISAWLCGMLVDRWGPRPVAAASVTLLAAGLVGVASARSPTAMLIACLAMGLVAGATLTLPYIVVIADRFRRNRGLALGIGACGAGLGGILIAPMVRALAERGSWRTGVMTLAVAVLAIGLPAALIGLRRPRHVRPVQHGTRAALFRLPAFWLIAGAIAIATFGVGAAPVQAAALLTDRGIDKAAAAGVLSAMAAASIAGRLIAGWLLDRLSAPQVAAGFFVVAGLGLTMVASTAAYSWLFAGFVLVGLTLGAESDLSAYLIARYLPAVSHGRAIGLVIAAFSLSNALGVAAFGQIFDRTGSYGPGLLVGTAMALAAALIVSRLRRCAPAEGG